MDWEVSVLGFGVRRLPRLGNNPLEIDEAESIGILRYAIDHGVNYLDLGCPYDLKQQERLTTVVYLALGDGYRAKIRLAASLPSLLIKSSADFDGYLNQQLKWLKSDSIDFFLLGWLNHESWPRLKELGVLGWAEGAMADGRIGRLGFSLHDHFQVLRGILNDYDSWTLAQFQYSYMDANYLPGVSGLKYASDKGLAVVAAEPLRGGRLTKEPPPSVAKVWATAPRKHSLAEWGLRWVWNHPEVATAVSDMSAMEQLKKNVALADNAQADSLTVADEVLISRARDAYRKLRPIPCTACRGCMPCPQGIDVPRLFELYNDAIMYGDMETARAIYQLEKHDINSCNQCGLCVCGREIPILDWLKELSGAWAKE
ncbi:MAG: aldo/keto reductase [Dehalococcoidales bacterium]|nr:aldo/keto reductase [Dehalococcoidales bacterium]